MVVVNFKRFAVGERAVNLARICRDVRDEMGIRIVCAVMAADYESCKSTGAECWTQRWEEGLKNVSGTLVNHSDYKLEWEEIKTQSAKCKVQNTEVCICCETLKEGIRVADLEPSWVAFEPRELIGNREKSVSSEEGETIKQLAREITVPVLVGAGIHSKKDVEIALKLGARGILVATDVAKAGDPEKELRELVKAFKS